MKIDTKSRHITPAGGNVFADLGFKPEQAAALQAESKRIISEKLAIKKRLMGEISGWIEENALTHADAARILGVSRPRVSDVVHAKSVKFTFDALVDMLARAGRQVTVSVR